MMRILGMLGLAPLSLLKECRFIMEVSRDMLKKQDPQIAALVKDNKRLRALTKGKA